MEDMNSWRQARIATLHCLSGCATGEILGIVIGAALGLSNFNTIILAIGLAFFFGYLFTVYFLRKHLPIKEAIKIAIIADSLSILVMEIVDNAVLLLIPGFMNMHLDEPLFWLGLAFSLFIAYWVAVPLNKYLISKNKGHALHHNHH